MANVKNESVASKFVVTVIGDVKENKLAVDKDKVNGSLVVQYGDKIQDQVEVKLYVSRLKDEKDSNGNKTGNKIDNPKYDKLKELSSKLISKANENDEQKASTVRIMGKAPFAPSVRLNEYYDENNDKINSNVEISLGFSNIYEAEIPKEQFKGEFDMIVYLHKAPIMEIKNEEETGRLIVEALFIEYDGAVKPITFVVEDAELIEGISECEKGQTVNLWGSCQVAQITETKEKKSGFGGKAKTETQTFTQRQLLVEGGDPIDEDDKDAIDSEYIKKALVERETFLENLKNKEKKDSKPKGKGGFGGNGGSKTTGDIPF